MGNAGVLLVALSLVTSEPPPETGPLSDEELALVAALTATVAPATETPSTPETLDDRELQLTLARNVAHALDGLPTLFRTYRGRDVLTLVRDGVRLPATHGFTRLQDGWLSLDPNAVGAARWSPTSGVGLGATLTLDGPAVPESGAVTMARGVARTADRGLAAHARLGFGTEHRGIVAGGRFESLPTLRLQSEDAGAEDGDALGEQWSVHLRATEWRPNLRFGVDWNRRARGRVEGPRPQTLDRIDHGLVFAAVQGGWGEVVAAYLRDELAGSFSRSTDRAQVSARVEFSLNDAWRVQAGGFGQLDDQRFISDRGQAMRAEPSLGVRFASDGFDLHWTGSLLIGSVRVRGDRVITAVTPTLRFVATGPFGAGLGWRLAVVRGAHQPQPWNVPAGVIDAEVETSWTFEAGPTWRGRAGWARLSAFAQRVENFWPRTPLLGPDRDDSDFQVIGLEATASVELTRGLDLRVAAGWAEDQTSAPKFETVRPAAGRVRGFASLRYRFSKRRGFVEAHGRWITDALALREGAGIDDRGEPLRLGVRGGVDLGAGLSVSVAVENVLDRAYDDPLVDRDQVGLDARLALTFRMPK